MLAYHPQTDKHTCTHTIHRKTNTHTIHRQTHMHAQHPQTDKHICTLAKIAKIKFKKSIFHWAAI